MLWVSLEVPHWGTSNECHNMCSRRNKTNSRLDASIFCKEIRQKALETQQMFLLTIKKNGRWDVSNKYKNIFWGEKNQSLGK